MEAEDWKYSKAYVEMLCPEKITKRQYDMEDDDFECVLTDILIFPFMKCDKDIDGYVTLSHSYGHFFVIASGLVGTHWLFNTLYGHPPLIWGLPFLVSHRYDRFL